jgi:pilus assembly protein CpaC
MSQSIARQSAYAAYLFAFSVAVVSSAAAQATRPPSVIHRLESQNETLELTVNNSRILTIGKPLPRVQVNNPDLAEITALSETQVQVMAKKAGVTQVNLFDEDDNIYSVDLIIYPDAQELTMLLRTQFPTASLKVVPTANSVLISGYVDDPNEVKRIVEIASDYAPKVLNNIKVGGVQQVLLQAKVMEVSRTKLRNMGFDWGNIGARGDFVANGVGSLLNTATTSSTSTAAVTGLGPLVPSTAQNFNFGVVSGGSTFFGVLNLLVQKNVAKITAEPQLVTVSGRPATFLVGGLIPYPANASLGGVSFSFRPVGTQIDFVPIVLGNGAIRLEVRPQVSELDPSNSVTYNGTTIPGFQTRQCDTGVELRSGQTLALAGLVQQRLENQSRGVIGLSNIPLLGIPFRNMSGNYNEIETLILVTPQLVDAMDACEVPPGGPGYSTADPNDNEFYCRGHLEVPNCEGPNMSGPYPDPHGMFAPPQPDSPWSEDGKPAGNAPVQSVPPVQSTPIAPPATDSQSRSSPGYRQLDVPARPQPPRLRAVTTGNRNTTGFVAEESRAAGGPQPTVKRGTPRQKKAPGFIGPTGYDLR